MRHKKLISLALIAALAMSAATPVYADNAPGAAALSNRPRKFDDGLSNTTSDTSNDTSYTVDYAQVEQMVLDRNLQVQSNGMTLGSLTNENEMKQKYSQLASAVQSAEGNLNAILNDPTTPTDPTDKKMQGNLKIVAGGTITALSSLLAMFSAQADTSDDDYKLTELQMTEANNQLVKSAQSMFSVYYQLQYNIQQLTNTRVISEEAVKTAQTQYQLGLGTSAAVTDAQNSVTTLDNNIAGLQNQSKEMGYQMNQLLGHSYNDQIKFGKMPEPDPSFLGKIDLKKDVAAAQTASYDVQIKQLQRTLLIDESTNQNRDQKQIKSNDISMAIQKVGSSVEAQYDTVKNQQATLTQEQKNFASAKLKRDQAQLKYNTGALSLIDLNTAKNNYLKQETVVETAQSTLFWDIELYGWIVKGLPAS